MEQRDPMLDVFASNLMSFACGMKENYAPEKYHFLMAKELQAVMRGEVKRLIIQMPPQHGKSETATRLFPAFYFGHFPKHSLIVGAYNQTKADEFGRHTKEYMQSELYKAIFPDTKINPNKNAVDEFEILNGGTYIAAGINGSVTGGGANGIIIDDPYKNQQEADSETVSENIINLWKSTWRTRLRGDGWIIIIQTRWNKRDLIQWLLDNESDDPAYKWKIVNLKAVIEDEEDEKNDPLKRKIGETLWPSMFPARVMADMKNSVGPKVWNSLYQGQPTDAQGELFLRKNWNYWCRKNCNAEHEHHPLPTKIDSKMQVWDCSFKDLSTSDYVVGGVGYKAGPNLYIIDAMRKRATAKATCDMIRQMIIRHPDVIKIGVEDKANGPEVIATMKQEVSGVVEIPANGSKDSRASAASIHQESGNIYLPYEAIWKEELIEECAAYPNGKYDDYVDMVSHMAIQMLGNRVSGMLEWMKEQVEKLRNKAA